MENCWIFVKCDWTNLLRVEFLFQPPIWRVELLEDHPLRSDKFLYQQHHVTFEKMETFQEFHAKSSCGCSGFVDHFCVLFCIRQSCEWKTRHVKFDFVFCLCFHVSVSVKAD